MRCGRRGCEGISRGDEPRTPGSGCAFVSYVLGNTKRELIRQAVL